MACMQICEIKFWAFGLTGRICQVISLVGVRRGMTFFCCLVSSWICSFSLLERENVGLWGFKDLRDLTDLICHGQSSKHWSLGNIWVIVSPTKHQYKKTHCITQSESLSQPGVKLFYLLIILLLNKSITLFMSLCYIYGLPSPWYAASSSYNPFIVWWCDCQ